MNTEQLDYLLALARDAGRCASRLAAAEHVYDSARHASPAKRHAYADMNRARKASALAEGALVAARKLVSL